MSKNTTHARISKEVLDEIDNLKRRCMDIENRDLSRNEILRRMTHTDIKKLIIRDSEIKRRLGV